MVLEEAAQRIAATTRDTVLVPQRVGAQHNHHAGLRLHAVHVALLVEGRHLQGALPGAEEEDDHEPVPDEGVEPLDDDVVGHLRGVALQHPGLVHEARRPAADVQVQLPRRGGRGDERRHGGQRLVQLAEGRAELLLRGQLEGADGALVAEEAIDDDARRRLETARHVHLLGLLARLLDEGAQPVGLDGAVGLELESFPNFFSEGLRVVSEALHHVIPHPSLLQRHGCTCCWADAGERRATPGRAHPPDHQWAWPQR
mmetsp:Transcript_110190/g.344794  ORF Transcript_110190/g.344794 Transcript_110190/m.344794 type:complete len:257 (-) Transcript_110190:13-783(-)